MNGKLKFISKSERENKKLLELKLSEDKMNIRIQENKKNLLKSLIEAKQKPTLGKRLKEDPEEHGMTTEEITTLKVLSSTETILIHT